MGAARNRTPAANRPPTKLLREVDHFFIQTDQPALVFEQLRTNLGLPVVWPLTEYGEFTSGGFWVGNTMLEVVTFNEQLLGTGRLAAFRGVAFEPALPIRRCLRELTTRGLPVEPTNWNAAVDGPEPDEEVGGHINLPSLGGDATVFILAHPFNPMPFPEDRREELIAAGPKTMADARRLLSKGRQEKPFGSLGILGVEEIVFGTADPDTARGQWSLLFAGPSGTSSCWRLQHGPNIRLISSEVDGIVRVTMRVQSIEDARRFAKAQGFGAGAEDEDELVVKPSDGLEVRLIQPA